METNPNFADNSPEVIETQVQPTEIPVTDASQASEAPEFDYANATGSQRVEYLTSLFASGASEAAQELPESTETTEVSESPQDEPQSIEPRDPIPDKFKNESGEIDVAKLLKSYLNMEQMHSKSQNATYLESLQENLKTRDAVIQALQVQLQQVQQFQQQQATTQQQEPETPQINTEEWLEKFYENPVEAVSEAVSSEVERRLAEQAQQREREQADYYQRLAYWNDKVNECKQSHPDDFDLLRPKMQEIINARGREFEHLPDAMEIIYRLAKSDSFQAQEAPAQPDIEDLLKQEEIRSKIASDPEIQKLILSQHAKGVIQAPKPTLIGNQAGGMAAVTPPTEIKSTKDAAKASASFFQRVFGGS